MRSPAWAAVVPSGHGVHGLAADGDQVDPDPPGRSARPRKGAEDADGKQIGRRTILGMIGLGAVGVVVGARVQNSIQHWMLPITLHDPTGLTSYLPGSSNFRIYSVTGDLPHAPVPYQLRVDGLVDKQLDLSLEDLTTKLPQTMLTRDFQCVTGWRVPDVKWVGVKLSDILDQAGVQSTATALRFTSFDGTYTESLSLSQARLADTIVATQMLGKPVTREHGGPVRLYVAQMYGYKSCKWLSGIELTAQVEPGYWENLGYDVDGFIGRSNGRHDQPVR